ncbi:MULTISPECIES: hypothetical protein, partial [unclassified Variovorax]|uniref:hypothetical protein n=1 Tax=unclassified Variovorax TaxID=663243 RepID=UPI003F446895
MSRVRGSNAVSFRRRGEATDTAPGRKPSVAYVSQLAAENNIRTKLALLVRWLRVDATEASGGNDVITGLAPPTSVRQFNRWESALGSAQEFRRNSNDTLRKQAQLWSSVKDAIRAVSAKASCDEKPPSNREQRLATARRAQHIERTLRQIAERELVRVRRELVVAKSESLTLRAR